MPRANRHFLRGHVWHIRHQCSSQFQSFQSFNRFAPFQLSKAGRGSRVQGSKVQEFNRCAPFKTFSE
jgi:hypothetical protein